jgi:tRNA 2-thiouridine synthesizing protein A
MTGHDGAAAADGPASNGPTSNGPTEIVDCLGQRCPLPVIALARRLPALPIGGVLRVLANDPAAAVDIPAWCRLRGQEYLGSPSTDAYDVRRVA